MWLSTKTPSYNSENLFSKIMTCNSPFRVRANGVFCFLAANDGVKTMQATNSQPYQTESMVRLSINVLRSALKSRGKRKSFKKIWPQSTQPSLLPVCYFFLMPLWRHKAELGDHTSSYVSSGCLHFYVYITGALNEDAECSERLAVGLDTIKIRQGGVFSRDKVIWYWTSPSLLRKPNTILRSLSLN